MINKVLQTEQYIMKAIKTLLNVIWIIHNGVSRLIKKILFGGFAIDRKSSAFISIFKVFLNQFYKKKYETESYLIYSLKFPKYLVDFWQCIDLTCYRSLCRQTHQKSTNTDRYTSGFVDIVPIRYLAYFTSHKVCSFTCIFVEEKVLFLDFSHLSTK